MASLFVLAAAVAQAASSAVTGAAASTGAGADLAPATGSVAGAVVGTAQAVDALSGGAGVRGAVEGVVSIPATGVMEQGASALANATSPLANATAPLAQAATTTSTVLGEAGFSWGGYFQAIGVLFLLLAVLWGGLWCLRKYGKFNFIPKPGMLPRNALRLEAQLPLGPRKGLMVVRFLNKRLLLGVTDHQITLLTESDDQHESNNSLEFKDIIEEAQRQKTDA